MATSIKKKKKVKLDLLINIGLLLMVEKGIRGGICHAYYSYAESKNKYVKDCDKNKELSRLMYWNVSNLHGSPVS